MWSQDRMAELWASCKYCIPTKYILSKVLQDKLFEQMLCGAPQWWASWHNYEAEKAEEKQELVSTRQLEELR